MYKFPSIFVQFKCFLPNLGFLLDPYFDQDASCYTRTGCPCILECLVISAGKEGSIINISMVKSIQQ